MTVDVLIATSLEPELVALVEAVDPRLRVHYEPDLLPVPRFPADHDGIKPKLDPLRWADLLAGAEVMYGLDWVDPAGMPVACPRLRWVQGTSAGMGGYLARHDLLAVDFTITTAAGVHGLPLAEFALTGVLHFVKDVPGLLARQSDRLWKRHTTSQLAGKRALVIGTGGIGREVGALFTALGVHVRGLSSSATDADLDRALPETDVLVLACPLTERTRGLISRERLGLLPPHAILVNLARGQVVEETALLDALHASALGGACLDVVHTEPLPPDSPVWAAPNLLLSPHSASNVVEENARIVDLFVDNLRRYLAGEPLRNVFDAARGY
jgi:phosphoglycerate dehydrogenase-like enzyme